MNKTWNLKSLKLELQTWGEFEGKYIGSIIFENGKDAFTCDITPEKAAEFLKLIQKEVMNNASDLKEKLAESLKFLTNGSAQPVLTIEAAQPEPANNNQ